MPIDVRRSTLATAFVAGFIGLASPAAAVPDNVKPGGTLVVALSGDPEVLNSGITTDITSSNISGQVYSTIVRLDNDGNVKPDLARSWEISPDGLTYTFKLFENIKWHDGVPFTAEDIVWGLQNVNKKYNGPSSGLLAPVDSLTAPDKYTVVFKLKYAYPPLLRGLAYFNSSTILPKHIFDNGDDPRKNPANFKPIGTGPFIFKEYQKGDHVTFEKNPNYHLPGQPYVDRLIFQIIPNDAARAIALQKGDVDFIPYYAITLGQVEDLKKDPKVGTTIAKRMIAGEYMAFINMRNAPLDKKEVRQALYYAMNRNDFLEKAGFGFGKVSVGPISSEQPTFYTDKVTLYGYDPARAERMLDAAGLTRKADGKRFSLRVSFDQKEGPMDDVARLMRANFARIGVDLVIQGMDTGAWTETAFRQWNYDITMGSFSTGPDPAIGVERLYVCRMREKLLGRNASGYCNPEMDAMLEAAGKETDDAKRAVIYHKVQAQLAEDVPHFWLWDRYYPIAFNAGLVGLPQDPTAYGAFDTVGWKK
jgi:peptide/nickel transport system substrate-binding protein